MRDHSSTEGLKEKKWLLYILECKDGSLYTGITDDLERRIAAHRSGRGAKYTRGRGPLILRFVQECASRSDALKEEIRIKKLPRLQKIQLCIDYGAYNK